MSNYILVINPGSTSTKIGVFENDTLLFDKTLRHPAEEIAKFATIPDQKSWRKELVEQAFLDTYESGEEEQLMLRQAQHYLEKKGYVPDSCDWKEKQKLYGFLLRKGIPTRVIRRVLEGIEDY